MVWKKLWAVSAVASIALAGLACGKAPTVTGSQSAQHKDAVPMNDYSELASNDAVERFMAFLSGLDRLSDVSAESMQHKLGLTFQREGKVAGYRSVAASDGWRYFIDFYDEDLPSNRGFSFEFVNANNAADISPVCTHDFEAFRRILLGAGFVEQKQVGEIGQLIAFNYTKADLKVAVFIRSAAGDPGRNCVRRIQTIQ